MFYFWLENIRGISQDEYSDYPAWLQLQLLDEYLDDRVYDVSEERR